MAKREFIETKEVVYTNAPIAPILQGDSVHYEDIAFKAQIGHIHTFSEQEIVKPYLDKIREEIDKARFIDKDTRICKNALASGLEVAMHIIDKCREESEDKE